VLVAIMEINLQIDANGRTTYDRDKVELRSALSTSNFEECPSVSVDYSAKTQTFNELLSTTYNEQPILDLLRKDCEVAVDASLPWTFWMPCDAKVSRMMRRAELEYCM